MAKDDVALLCERFVAAITQFWKPRFLLSFFFWFKVFFSWYYVIPTLEENHKEFIPPLTFVLFSIALTVLFSGSGFLWRWGAYNRWWTWRSEGKIFILGSVENVLTLCRNQILTFCMYIWAVSHSYSTPWTLPKGRQWLAHNCYYNAGNYDLFLLWFCAHSATILICNTRATNLLHSIIQVNPQFIQNCHVRPIARTCSKSGYLKRVTELDGTSKLTRENAWNLTLLGIIWWISQTDHNQRGWKEVAIRKAYAVIILWRGSPISPFSKAS